MKQINWPDHILNFIAVIIGVSLAFYVNDRSERSQDRREQKKILQSMIDELDFDMEVYENHQINLNQSQSELIQEVIDMIRREETDSLSHKFLKCLNYTNYSPRSVTFNSILASGKLDLIEDFDLRRQLSVYHEIWVSEVEFRVSKQISFAENRLIPWVMANTDFQTPDPKDLQKRELVNMLFVYQGLIDGKIRNYNQLLSEAKSLQENLQKYLDEE